MEKQKKLKFNLVDVIVILVLVAGVAFVALRMFGSDSSGGSNSGDSQSGQQYIITYFTAESANYVVDHLRAGSTLTDDAIALDLGTLVDFKVGPAQVSSAAADGHLVISNKEGYSSVYLMGKVPGVDNGYGVTVDGLKLEIGHSMVVRSQEAKFWVYVYDIQKLEDSPYAG